MPKIQVVDCDACPFDGVQVGYYEQTCGLYFYLNKEDSPEPQIDHCPLKDGECVVELVEINTKD